MQQKHILSLLRDDFVTALVIFQPTTVTETPLPAAPPMAPPAMPAPWDSRPTAKRYMAPGNYTQTPQGYTYKAKKSLKLQPGDAVVVPSARGLGIKIGLVHSVQEVPDIDLDAPFEYKWIVDKVDTTEYDKTLTEERQFMQLAQEAERQHQREILKGKFMEHLPADSLGRRMFEEAVNKLQRGALAAPAQPMPADAGDAPTTR